MHAGELEPLLSPVGESVDAEDCDECRESKDKGNKGSKSSETAVSVRPPTPICWACWEPTHSFWKPLVRVCLGCLDPELQYIHQACIDKFINALPPQRLALDPLADPPVLFYCTRCKHPYHVTTKTLHPLLVVWRDRPARYLVLALTLAEVVLLACGVALLFIDSVNEVVFVFLQIELTYLAISIFLITTAVLSGRNCRHYCQSIRFLV